MDAMEQSCVFVAWMLARCGLFGTTAAVVVAVVVYGRWSTAWRRGRRWRLRCDGRVDKVPDNKSVWFDGAVPEPRKGIRSGHVPGSKCIPFNEVLNDRKELLDSNELAKRFEKEGISLDYPVVASCGTGVTACILALGLHRLGKCDVAVYDGSWTEWGAQSDTPVDVSASAT